MPTSNHLAFIVQPSNTVVSQPMSPGPQVGVFDSQGHLVTTATDRISLWFTRPDPADGSGAWVGMKGFLDVNAVNGIARFDVQAIWPASTGYLGSATAFGLTPGTSSPFEITAQ